jgi:hypothetical protein
MAYCGIQLNQLINFFYGEITLNSKLDPDQLFLLVKHYAEQGNPIAITTLISFSKIGLQEFLYKSCNIISKDYLELLKVKIRNDNLNLLNNILKELKGGLGLSSEEYLQLCQDAMETRLPDLYGCLPVFD